MDNDMGEVCPLTDFELAAIACGHNTRTDVGAENARHDHRVYDLLDAWAVAEHIAKARAAIENSSQVSW